MTDFPPELVEMVARGIAGAAFADLLPDITSIIHSPADYARRYWKDYVPMARAALSSLSAEGWEIGPGWKTIETAPTNRQFDAWVVHPDAPSGGYREPRARIKDGEVVNAAGHPICAMRQADGTWAIRPTHYREVPTTPHRV